MNLDPEEGKELNNETKFLFDLIQSLYARDIQQLKDEKNNFFKTKKFLLTTCGGAALSIIAFSKIPHFSRKQKYIGSLATSFSWGSFLTGRFLLKNKRSEEKKKKEKDSYEKREGFELDVKKLQNFIEEYDWKDEAEKVNFQTGFSGLVEINRKLKGKEASVSDDPNSDSKAGLIERLLKFDFMAEFQKIYGEYIPIYGNSFNPTAWYKGNLIKYSDLVLDTFAVVPGKSENNKQLLQSIFWRLPVYVGGSGPIQDKFKKEFIFDFEEKRSGITIIGTAMAFKNSSPITEKGRFISSHMFGLNFESQNTDDYNRYLDKKGNFKEEAIDAIQEELFSRYYVSMIATAKYMDLHKITKVEKCFPLIGMGAYLNSLNKKNKDKMFEINIKALLNALSKIRSEEKDISVRLFAYEQQDFDALNKITEKQEFFTYEQGNLFDFEEIRDGKVKFYEIENKKYISGRGGRCLEVVNAWDNLSLIGNGQTKDPTVDGYYVSGNRNTCLKNTSFLCNLFITNLKLAQNAVYYIPQEDTQYKNLKMIDSKYIEDAFLTREKIFKQDYLNKLKALNI